MNLQTATRAVTVSRVFDARPEVLFAAWTDVEALMKWFGPPGTHLVSAEADVRPGGKYHLVIDDDGALSDLTGEYVEVSPPNRLIFTWALSNQPCAGVPDMVPNTLVTVDFAAASNGRTTLTITHEGLPPAARQGHEAGWFGCLDELARTMTARAFAG